MTIRGKVALVVGASGAIGQAIALEFAREGAIVAVTSRSALKSGLMEQISTLNAGCKWFQLDVRNLASVQKVIGAADRELGPLEILINAAGAYGPIGPVAENDPEHWADAVQTNIVGAFNLVYAVVPVMSSHGRGRIVHFSGGGGAYGRPFFSCYSSCKAAVVRFTESAGKELAEKNIFMNAIAPGPVKSGMWEELRAAGAAAGGDALRELDSIDKTGGVPPERAARLAVLLAATQVPIAGRVISAVWDDWEHLELHADKLIGSEAWTLRRVPLHGEL